MVYYFVLFPRYSAVCLVLFPGLYVGLSCSVSRGIPRFSFFCSPALNAGFSLCIFRASLREPLRAPHCPVSAVFRGLSCSLAPQCPVSASFASGFLLRSLAPHCMRVFFLGSYAGFNPASGSCFGLFTCRWLPAYFAANCSRAAFRAGVSFHLVGHRCTICCPLY